MITEFDQLTDAGGRDVSPATEGRSSALNSAHVVVSGLLISNIRAAGLRATMTPGRVLSLDKTFSLFRHQALGINRMLLVLRVALRGRERHRR